jgi:hypothetical protein
MAVGNVQPLTAIGFLLLQLDASPRQVYNLLINNGEPSPVPAFQMQPVTFSLCKQVGCLNV